MITETLLALVAAGAGGIAIAQWKRSAIYTRLNDRIAATGSASRIDFGSILQRPLPTFTQRLAQVHDALPAETLAELRNQALSLVRPERSYIPTHKKGGTVAYETLFETAPLIVSLYHSREMRTLVSHLVGEAVQPTPINDQSSLSVLFYEKPGDHIGWHYDHNFYRGRHFTVLLPVMNQGSARDGLSHAILQAKLADVETDIATPPNSLIVFEGACVNHKVTPIKQGERRLVISMTYCTDSRASRLQAMTRRIKDVAFFGPRALWT